MFVLVNIWQKLEWAIPQSKLSEIVAENLAEIMAKRSNETLAESSTEMLTDNSDFLQKRVSVQKNTDMERSLILHA